MPCDYTSDNVFKIVIVTIAITLLVVGFIFLVIWLYLCKRNANKLDISYDSHAAQLNIITPNSFNNQKDIHSRFAFDNPYFKDDENDFIAPTQDLNFKNNFSSDATILTNGNAFKNENLIQNNHKLVDKKDKNLQNNSITKKAWEDGDKTELCKKVSVDLIGHDFTGLGFNICGNMKDGIFVKDVLSRGPANESKKIKPGDKITSLTISMKNMVYEDALTILSYASPYNVTINLEKKKQTSFNDFNKGSKNLKLKKLKNLPEHRKSNYSMKSMSHPLYKTRSVDNLIQVSNKKNLNYGTSAVNLNQNNWNKDFYENDKPRNGYERMINKFKQQILSYMSNGNINNEFHVQEISNDETINKKKNVSSSSLSTFQKLFKTNIPNWNENSNKFNDNHNLNAIVVGNNLAFKDDDEDEEFSREFQMSQLKFQQQQQQSATIHFKNYQQNNLNNFSSYSNINEVDGLNDNYNDQFVTINLENLNQAEGYINKEKMKFGDFSNNCKGNSSQLTDLNKSLMSYSSFNSVPLTEVGYNEIPEQSTDSINNINITTAEIHFTDDQTFVKNLNQVIESNKNDLNDKNLNDNESSDENKLIKNNKLRSSSMNDLPKEEKIFINLNKTIDENRNIYPKNHLERATSLNLEENFKNFNNIDDKSLLVSKTYFNQNLYNDLKNKEVFVCSLEKTNKDKTIKIIQTQSSNSKELKEEELKNKDKLSQYGLNHKTIRNSLSTNSTCSNLSSQSSIKLDDEDQDKLLIIKPSNLINISNKERIDLENNFMNEKLEKNNLENIDLENSNLEKNNLENIDLEKKEKILKLVNQNNVDENSKKELFSNKNEDKNYDLSTNKFIEPLKISEKRKIFEYSENGKAKIIINDVLKKNSIHNLNSIKSEKINNELTKNKYQKKQSNEKLINYDNKKEKLTDSFKDAFKNLNTNDKLINKENKIDNKTSENTIKDNEILNLKNRVSRLKKEFSLKRKEIENQKFNKSRKITEIKDKKIYNKNVIPISKQQQQILNNTSLDFESWSFNENNKN